MKIRIRICVEGEFGLLNPIYVLGAVIAVIALCWRKNRTSLNLYLFCMGAPVVFTYFILSFHTRILQNWIVPAVIPWFILTVIWWQSVWPPVSTRLRTALKSVVISGLVLGGLAVVLAHDTKLIDKMFGRTLPPKFDLLHRVHGWKELAAIVGNARQKLEAEGKPTFIIGEHYGFTGQVRRFICRKQKRR